MRVALTTPWQRRLASPRQTLSTLSCASIRAVSEARTAASVWMQTGETLAWFATRHWPTPLLASGTPLQCFWTSAPQSRAMIDIASAKLIVAA
jgi:hypothetical protein